MNRSLRVLVVEDESVIAMMTEDLLVELGHVVTGTVARVDKAASLAATAPIDLAILDVNLDGEWTYPVAEALRDRGVPFIFATGYGATSLDPAWRDRPVLQKPFELRDMARSIQAALST